MTLRVSKHSNQPCSVIFVNFYNFLNNDVIVSSLVSTGNCKLNHYCRRVCSHRRHDENVANQLRIRVHTTDADATKQFRRVGGVYWALGDEAIRFTQQPLMTKNKKLSDCWETVRRDRMPRIAEMDVKMTTQAEMTFKILQGHQKWHQLKASV